MSETLKDYKEGSVVRARIGRRLLKWWVIVRFTGNQCVLKEKYGGKEVTVLSETPVTEVK